MLLLLASIGLHRKFNMTLSDFDIIQIKEEKSAQLVIHARVYFRHQDTLMD